MPQPKKAPRFGGSPAHHKLLVANLATELFRHGRIRTTVAKAKAVQPVAERLITFAKRGDLHARRQVLRVVRDRDVVHKLFADVGPAFAERDGGYTRVLKLGPRKGDAAPMALIELVEGVDISGEGDLAEQPRRRWALRRRSGATLSATAAQAAEERQAALDRGELEEPVVAGEEDEFDESAQEAAPTERAPADEGTGLDPAEVEARLAAQEQATSGQDVAEPEPSAEADAADAEDGAAQDAAEGGTADAGDEAAGDDEPER